MRSRSCFAFNPVGFALAMCSTASHAKGGRQNAVLHSVVKDCVSCTHRGEGVHPNSSLLLTIMGLLCAAFSENHPVA